MALMCNFIDFIINKELFFITLRTKIWSLKNPVNMIWNAQDLSG